MTSQQESHDGAVEETEVSGVIKSPDELDPDVEDIRLAVEGAVKDDGNTVNRPRGASRPPNRCSTEAEDVPCNSGSDTKPNRPSPRGLNRPPVFPHTPRNDNEG